MIDDETTMTPEAFGRSLRTRRLAQGLTQVELAQRLRELQVRDGYGRHPHGDMISRWETGVCLPHPATRARLALLLDGSQ